MNFLNGLGKRILVLDGAMGTMLQKSGAIITTCGDELNITNPNAVASVHKEYANCGVDMLLTNTFGANQLKLSNYHLQDKVKQINEAGVNIARKAAPNCFIAGNIGPTGKFIEPIGELTFDEAYSIFAEQTKALRNADLIQIETFMDIKELKAAVIAAKENSSLPIAASMTFEGLRTNAGTDPETMVAVLTALDVDMIGINCGLGPKEMYEIVKILVKKSKKPLFVEPNAGLPKLIDGKAVFDAAPEFMAEYAQKFVELGVEIVGGCCGTTPEHIKAIADVVKNHKLVRRNVSRQFTLSSRTKTIEYKDKPLILGERINPTSKKDLTEEIKHGKTALIRKLALEQKKAGADAIDINVGVPGIDEIEMLKKAVIAVQSTVDLPVVIDSSNQEAIEEALKSVDGKALINSVNAKEESLKTILPLAKKYGAAVIGLTLDKNIPKTKEEILAIAEKIISNASIPQEDILIDCLTMGCATNQKRPKESLEAIKELTGRGIKTVLGISNISHGLPARQRLNSTFFNLAKANGLSAAIINPGSDLSQAYQDAEDVLLGRDINALKYIKSQQQGDEKEPLSKDAPVQDKIYDAILNGDPENIVELVEIALKTMKPLEINGLMITAIEEVGKKFKCNEYFLPQVILSADAMKNAFKRLKQEFKHENTKPKATIVFATVKDDIHDLGKNIVISLLETHNYDVVDLGKDVSKDEIIEAVKKYKADLLCLSALMTTTIIHMPEIINALHQEGIKIPVMVGGAVVNKDWADKIGAGYARDGVEAVDVIQRLHYAKDN